MAFFKQLNCWNVEQQELLSAGFADMLHDDERNHKYYAAIRKTIHSLHSRGIEAHVLDIGTGTGILAMMAAKAGADSVVACEQYLPMAECAENIIEENGFTGRIQVIHKRSTEIEVGIEMARRANVLVTELFDTELIGEGAISIYNHAHDELLTDDVVCIPSKATCYAQIVQSPLAAQCNTIKSLVNLDGEVLLEPSEEIKKCHGDAALHDLQLSQIPLEDFKTLSNPIEIFEFDFTCKSPRPANRTNNVKVKPIATGSTDSVFFWWSLQMDFANDIQLYCAPYWAHPDVLRYQEIDDRSLSIENVIPWRDHWMQAIYYIPKPLHVTENDSEIILQCNHDEFSFWFDTFKITNPPTQAVPRHACNCVVHLIYGRNRFAQINDSRRNKKYLRYLEANITKESNVLSLGDGNLLGLATSKLGAANVICHEPNRFSRSFMEKTAKDNSIENVKFVEKLKDLDDDTLSKITHVFAEPYFFNSLLPYENVYFGNLLQQVKGKLPKNVKISPHSVQLYGVPVEFLNLQKIRQPIGDYNGFKLDIFDKMLKIKSYDLTKVESQPLWEYPCRAVAKPRKLINIKFNNYVTQDWVTGAIEHEWADCAINAVAVWIEWNIDGGKTPDSIISTGPTEPIVVGEFIKWPMFVRQGVHIFNEDHPYRVYDDLKTTVNYNIEFFPKKLLLNVRFACVKPGIHKPRPKVDED